LALKIELTFMKKTQFKKGRKKGPQGC